MSYDFDKIVRQFRALQMRLGMAGLEPEDARVLAAAILAQDVGSSAATEDGV
jgi:hypothetical protein